MGFRFKKSETFWGYTVATTVDPQRDGTTVFYTFLLGISWCSIARIHNNCLFLAGWYLPLLRPGSFSAERGVADLEVWKPGSSFRDICRFLRGISDGRLVRSILEAPVKLTLPRSIYKLRQKSEGLGSPNEGSDPE